MRKLLLWSKVGLHGTLKQILTKINIGPNRPIDYSYNSTGLIRVGYTFLRTWKSGPTPFACVCTVQTKQGLMIGLTYHFLGLFSLIRYNPVEINGIKVSISRKSDITLQMLTFRCAFTINISIVDAQWVTISRVQISSHCASIFFHFKLDSTVRRTDAQTINAP